VQADQGRAGRAASSWSSYKHGPGGAPVRRLPSPGAPPLLLLLLWWCGDGGRGKEGAARVRGAAGALILGARVWGAAAAGGPRRSGWDAWRHPDGAARLCGRHGRRSDFAPVSWSRDKRGTAQAGDARERGRGGREKRKGGARRLGAPVAEWSERGWESCGGERREEEEGKADKQVPLVSCPVREMRGRGVRCVWLGWVAACGGRKEGVERSWAGPCARSPVSRGEEEMGGGPAACWSSRFR
jgi:hypothetical protein